MNFCINPCCPNPQNSDSLLFCQACGSALLIEGRYRVTRILGSGGFGTTYEIGYRGTLKVLKVLVNAQPKAVELFQREAQNLAELNDPGIPKVETDSYFTFLPKDCQEPVHCLVMEKIEGLDLREYLRQGGNRPLDGGLALIWMTELINILHQVHQKGIIHRDIKPQNIMLKPDGRLTLIDFGGSIRESTGTEVATQAARAGTGTEMATQARGKTSLSSFGYTPMEQINGQTFPQSDFFALGRTFIYLLTAQDPTSMDDALNGVNHWRKYTPKVSPQLADLVDWMTALLPKDRPANTQEILAQLGTLSSQAKPSPEPDPPIPQAGVLVGHSDWVKAVVISPDGKKLVSGSTDQTIKVWDLNLRKNIQTLSGHSDWVLSLTIGADWQNLVSGSADRTVRVWHLPTGELLQTFQGHSDWVTCTAFNSENRIVASGSADRTIRIWDLKRDKLLHTLKGQLGFIRAIAMSRDGQILASGGDDKTVKIWNPNKGRLLKIFKGHSGFIRTIAISDDGHTLVSGSDDKTIKVWNLLTGKLLSTLTGHEGSVTSVALSSKDLTLISGSDDRTVKVWDLNTGNLLRTFEGHTGSVMAVSVDSNSQIFVSGSEDKNVRIWNLN